MNGSGQERGAALALSGDYGGQTRGALGVKPSRVYHACSVRSPMMDDDQETHRMPVPAVAVARPVPPLDARPRRPPAIHPCIAYPDLYPEAGPPLGAGLIHGNACALLGGFVRARLLDLGLARDSFAVGLDVYVYADQRRASRTSAPICI